MQPAWIFFLFAYLFVYLFLQYIYYHTRLKKNLKIISPQSDDSSIAQLKNFTPLYTKLTISNSTSSELKNLGRRYNLRMENFEKHQTKEMGAVPNRTYLYRC